MNPSYIRRADSPSDRVVYDVHTGCFGCMLCPYPLLPDMKGPFRSPCLVSRSANQSCGRNMRSVGGPDGTRPELRRVDRTGALTPPRGIPCYEARVDGCCGRCDARPARVHLRCVMRCVLTNGSTVFRREYTHLLANKLCVKRMGCTERRDQ